MCNFPELFFWLPGWRSWKCFIACFTFRTTDASKWNSLVVIEAPSLSLLAPCRTPANGLLFHSSLPILRSRGGAVSRRLASHLAQTGRRLVPRGSQFPQGPELRALPGTLCCSLFPGVSQESERDWLRQRLSSNPQETSFLLISHYRKITYLGDRMQNSQIRQSSWIIILNY